jgi:hypothetical protein
MGQPSAIPFHKESRTVSRNGHGNKGQALSNAYPEDADARYAAALKLVQAIDRNLSNGTEHYYNTQGKLLNTLDEVIHAMLTDSLAPGKPTKYPQDPERVEWVPINELVA